MTGLLSFSGAVTDLGVPEKLCSLSANSLCCCGLGRGSLSSWGQARLLAGAQPSAPRHPIGSAMPVGPSHFPFLPEGVVRWCKVSGPESEVPRCGEHAAWGEPGVLGDAVGGGRAHMCVQVWGGVGRRERP